MLKQTYFSLEDVFGIKAPVQVLGYEAGQHPAVPKQNPHFHFRRDVVRDLVAFFANPFGDGLLLTGPTGAGKTSVIRQYAARTNWPVQEVTCHGRMELTDLVGVWTMVNGSMQFLPGPLTTAIREGHIMILNEMDLMDPSELAGLNSILDGSPLVIAQNGGEIVEQHPMFRLVATGNSAGNGDTSGRYQGVLMQNMALMDRFRVVGVSYPDAAVEEDILTKVVPGLPGSIRECMVKVANEIRRLFLGSDDSGAEISITMSTRSLLRWANLTLAFKGAPNAVEYALERALTARAEPEEKEAIHKIAENCFGDQWAGRS